jgi:hypothetical protein
VDLRANNIGENNMDRIIKGREYINAKGSACFMAIVLGSISPTINIIAVPITVAIRIAKFWSFIKDIDNPVMIAVNVTLTRLFPNKITESKLPGSFNIFATFKALVSPILIKCVSLEVFCIVKNADSALEKKADNIRHNRIIPNETI